LLPEDNLRNDQRWLWQAAALMTWRSYDRRNMRGVTSALQAIEPAQRDPVDPCEHAVTSAADPAAVHDDRATVVVLPLSGWTEAKARSLSMAEHDGRWAGGGSAVPLSYERFQVPDQRSLRGQVGVGHRRVSTVQPRRGADALPASPGACQLSGLPIRRR